MGELKTRALYLVLSFFLLIFARNRINVQIQKAQSYKAVTYPVKSPINSVGIKNYLEAVRKIHYIIS